MKRLWDVALSLGGLVLSAPLLLVAAALIKLDSRGPALFSQERIGRDFRPFRIYKLRTMRADPRASGPSVTSASDGRITRVGRWLRRYKLDELPQLFNVLLGDMSLVGPRPEVRRYVEAFRKDYEEILSIRPGLTDLASVKYRHEEEILAAAEDPEKAYLERVLPDKIALGKKYVRERGFLYDLALLLRTLARICRTGARGE